MPCLFCFVILAFDFATAQLLLLMLLIFVVVVGVAGVVVTLFVLVMLRCMITVLGAAAVDAINDCAEKTHR